MGLIPGDVSGLDETAGRTGGYNGRQCDIRKRNFGDGRVKIKDRHDTK